MASPAFTPSPFPAAPLQRKPAAPALNPPAAAAPPPPVAAPASPMVAHAPPPPPAAPVSAAQASVAAAATGAATGESYQARDGVFYHRAMLALLGALRPASRVYYFEKPPAPAPGASPVPATQARDFDREQAFEAARTLARIFDRGIVPPGFLLPEYVQLQGYIQEAEYLEAAGNGLPGTGKILRYAQGNGVPNPQGTTYVMLHPPTMHEGQRQKTRAKLDAIGPIPTREEVTSRNANALQAIANISEAVRDDALASAVARITARKDVTGAPAARNDAIGICVEAIMDSIELAPECGVPTMSAESYSDADSEAFGPAKLPYPAHLAVTVAVGLAYESDTVLAARAGLLDSAQDAEPAQGPAAQQKAPGA